MVSNDAPQQRHRKDAQKKLMDQEIENLNSRIGDEAPARGYAPPLQQVVSFSALPLSQATQRGLVEQNFSTLTAIQNACIPHALAERDILGAARTGSGKSLAFLVPVLEKLFRLKFVPDDGPGAVILSPTRELAIQLFQVLKKIGRHHTFSVGLLIGGKKDFYQEQQQIGSCNLIIATPGRLLQHLEQTPDLDMTNLQMLVLDEADRVLDMGFRTQLIRILDYLPSERQTLLFSATQTRDVSSLATLSLNQPEYLGVHDKEKTDTPENLQQSYVVIPLEHKLNAVYSFIKSHLKCKSIVFFATCAQVRHAHDLFCALRPGISVVALHGKLAQERRTKIYFDFVQRPAAVLFATDIAARGLDFPSVDWVVQTDAPEDRDMYIHRVGRTARFRSNGQSLLMITSSEEKRGLIELLQGGKNKVPLKKLRINPDKATIVTDRAASLVASNSVLNTLAKKAFQSYVRCIHLMPLKAIFNVADLELDGFAHSLGLAATPNLRFLEKAAKDRSQFRENKNVNKKLQRLKEQIKNEKLAKKLQNLGKKAGTEQFIEAQSQQRDSEDESDDDELLVSKTQSKHCETAETCEDLPDPEVYQVSKPRQSKKIRVGVFSGSNNHIVFNDKEEGESMGKSGLVLDAGDETNKNISHTRDSLEKATDTFVEKIRARLQSTKEKDYSDEKERVRQKHKKRRLDENHKREANNTSDHKSGFDVTLGNSDEMSPSASDSDSISSGYASSSHSAEIDPMNLQFQEERALALIRGTL